jgi:hypothetical protein
MNAQQLLDYIIKPTLEYMGGNYNSKKAQMLLLATAAIESKCGYYIKQIEGPALGIWQMEPATHEDIWENCDAGYGPIGQLVIDLASHNSVRYKGLFDGTQELINSPMYACAMARLKYSMDTAPLPAYNDMHEIYDYYKRIYNTPLGASTFEKFKSAWEECGLDDVVL